MLIRKLFRFENAHIVRGCSTRRCSHSIHGHYAQCFREDAANPRMGLIALENIEFSQAIRHEWPDPELFDQLKHGARKTNPNRV